MGTRHHSNTHYYLKQQTTKTKTATLFFSYNLFGCFPTLCTVRRQYFTMLCCLRNLYIWTETVFCNALLLMPSQTHDWDCFLQCFADYAISISRLRRYFAMLCCSHHFDISTETVFCNAMLLTTSWYLDWDCILQCFATDTFLISRLKLYFAMLRCLNHLDISTVMYFAILCCSNNLDISTKTVFCYAMLPTPSWYLDWECILQCFAAFTILISRLRLYFAMLCCLHHLNIASETVFCNAFGLTQSIYLNWNCILQWYPAYTILISRDRLILQCFAYTITISRQRLYYAQLCCLHTLDISTETVFCNALLLMPSRYLDWDCILAMLCCLRHLVI